MSLGFDVGYPLLVILGRIHLTARRRARLLDLYRL